MDIEVYWDIVLRRLLLSQKTCIFNNTSDRTSNLSFTFCSPDEILLKLSSGAVKMWDERGIEQTVFVLKLPVVLSEGKLNCCT